MKPAKMEDEFYEENRPSLAQQAARASLFAPFIALGVNVVGTPNFQEHPALPLIFALLECVILIAGLIFGIIGLWGVKKCFDTGEGWKSLFLISLLGLALNLAPFVFTLYFIFIAPLSKSMEGNRLTRALGESCEVKETKLTIIPPPGFQEMSPAAPGTSQAYRKPGIDENELGIWFVVIEIEGMLRPNEDQYLRNSFANSAPSDKVTFFTETWKGHTIEVARTEITSPDIVFEDNEMVPLVSFDVLVPIAPKAIIIKTNGMLAEEKEIKECIKEILRGVDGPTNWQ